MAHREHRLADDEPVGHPVELHAAEPGLLGPYGAPEVLLQRSLERAPAGAARVDERSVDVEEQDVGAQAASNSGERVGGQGPPYSRGPSPRSRRRIPTSAGP